MFCHPQRECYYSGCFEHKANCITVLAWLKKLERIYTSVIFNRFRLATLDSFYKHNGTAKCKVKLLIRKCS